MLVELWSSFYIYTLLHRSLSFLIWRDYNFFPLFLPILVWNCLPFQLRKMKSISFQVQYIWGPSSWFLAFLRPQNSYYIVLKVSTFIIPFLCWVWPYHRLILDRNLLKQFSKSKSMIHLINQMLDKTYLNFSHYLCCTQQPLQLFLIVLITLPISN